MDRREEYLRADGSFSGRRADAILISPVKVAGAAMLYSTIPAKYFVATAQHEANFAVNERDTEASGYVSKGIWQLADEEAESVSMAKADLYDLAESTHVFAVLQARRLMALLALPGVSMANPDILAYLAIAHNQGIAAAVKTIRSFGMDWAKYKERNRSNMPGICAYGNDCVTGGERWPEVLRALAT